MDNLEKMGKFPPKSQDILELANFETLITNVIQDRITARQEDIFTYAGEAKRVLNIWETSRRP